MAWKALISECLPDVLIAVPISLLKVCVWSVLGGFSVAHVGLTPLCRWARSVGLALWLLPAHSQKTIARECTPVTALTVPAFAQQRGVNIG